MISKISIPDATLPVLLVHPGPHGVAVYARQIATDIAAADVRVRVSTVDAVASVPEGTPVHAHVTDRLWGTSPEEATRTLTALAARHPLTVTLHDVPQESDGERNRPRRRAFYRSVVEAARGVAVNSAHERELLREEGVADGPIAVVPLPVVSSPAPTKAPGTDDSVGVLGYFYPGKGHDEALEAAVGAGLARVTVLGRASDGHAADLEAFVRRADAHGVSVEVTGWLDDAEMADRVRRVAVPVIAHRHVSASGSLASWIGWGRRPLAVRNRYNDEMAALRPGTVTLVEPADLAVAVAAARADVSSTWHGQHPVPFGPADAARAYLRWWSEVAA
ncbi:glycosyltransferase [Microbacterium testaceum]|uniref:glycosyltransferase n=1 Tax=Microbacterium testaceum TaxID=2033 RepID=UPI001247E4A4|nr:glycosyltransferase [Microbacterium testaceum]